MSVRLFPAPETHLVPLADALLVERDGAFAVVTDPAQRRALQRLHDRPSAPGRAGATPAATLVAADLALALPEPLHPVAAARWATLGLDAAAAAALAGTHAVCVDAPAAPVAGRTLLRAALAEWALTEQASGAEGRRPFPIVVVPDALHPAAAAAHEQATRAQHGWMLVVLGPTAAWAMVFDPGSAPCAACLQARLRYNRPTRALGRPATLLPPLTPALAVAVAAHLARSLAAPDAARCWTRLGVDGAVAAHPVVPRPSCPHCRAPAAPPDFRAWISPVTGLVHAPQTTATAGGPAIAAVRYRMSHAVASVDEAMRNERHVAGGKGWTPDDALRAATFEAIERRSGSWRAGLPHRWATARDLGAAALLPADVDLHSAAQRATPTDTLSMFAVPHPLDPARRVPWVAATALGATASGDAATRWFPAAAAFYDVPLEGPRYALPTSNGCAAGRTVRDAAWRGLCELVERDAVAIWWYNRLRRPALDPALLDASGRLAAFAEALAGAGRTLDLFDLATDVGLPVVAAVSRRIEAPGSEGGDGWVLGFSAAPTCLAAAEGAACEVAQLLPATDAADPPNPLVWADTASAADLPHLVPGAPAGAPPERPVLDLDALLARLRALGIAVYVVDQTHAEIGVPVVRVLAPGLVHFWRRLGAARLYDVPVRLGWRARPLTEAEVNPLDLTV